VQTTVYERKKGAAIGAATVRLTDVATNGVQNTVTNRPV
jgi:hypothetical protein